MLWLKYVVKLYFESFVGVSFKYDRSTCYFVVKILKFQTKQKNPVSRKTGFSFNYFLLRRKVSFENVYFSSA